MNGSNRFNVEHSFRKLICGTVMKFDEKYRQRKGPEQYSHKMWTEEEEEEVNDVESPARTAYID